MGKIKRVYLAGPYGADNVIDVLGNMRRGIKAGAQLVKEGYSVFCPWLDSQFSLVEYIGLQEYQRHSLGWVEVSDMVLLMPGWEKSKGTSREIEEAIKRGIPVREFRREDGGLE